MCLSRWRLIKVVQLSMSAVSYLLIYLLSTLSCIFRKLKLHLQKYLIVHKPGVIGLPGLSFTGFIVMNQYIQLSDLPSPSPQNGRYQQQFF